MDHQQASSTIDDDVIAEPPCEFNTPSHLESCTGINSQVPGNTLEHDFRMVTMDSDGIHSSPDVHVEHVVNSVSSDYRHLLSLSNGVLEHSTEGDTHPTHSINKHNRG